MVSLVPLIERPGAISVWTCSGPALGQCRAQPPPRLCCCCVLTPGEPTLDDFIGWSSYAVVIVSTRGDDDDDGSNPIIMTSVPAAGLASRFRDDWFADRVPLLGAGTFGIKLVCCPHLGPWSCLLYVIAAAA